MINQALSIKALLYAANTALRNLFIVTIALLPFAASSASAQQSTPSPTPSPQPTPSARAGIITGRIVTNDGQSLANARVNISQIGVSMLTRSNPVVTIDAQGNFRTSDLAPGAYGVSASLPGYLQVSITPGSLESGRYQPGDVITITLAKAGVITGQVTNERGEPVVAIGVRGIQIRTEDGRPGGTYPLIETDDRGHYRMFGLSPGTYIVSVNDDSQSPSLPSPYSRLTPTYYPSATRDTAKEITLRPGEEVSGIDIRFRNERGRTISGTVTGASESFVGPSALWLVMLARFPSSAPMTSGYNQRDTGVRNFTFYGLPDGEYELRAEYQVEPSKYYAASLTRRVTVKGADVAGLELPLLPLASVSGRIVAEALPPATRPAACAAEQIKSLQETRISARLDEKDEKEIPADRQRVVSVPLNGSMPNAQGEFTLFKLAAGHYRFSAPPINQHWYIRSITLPGAGNAMRDVGRDGLTIKLGEQVNGLTITVAEGSASLRGQVMPDKEGTRLPSRLSLYAVPVEERSADDVLRYAQAFVGANGKFGFEDLAPGKYWLLPRAETVSSARPAMQDSDERAKLRREAEAAKVEIELQPCQRVSDYTLRYAAPANK